MKKQLVIIILAILPLLFCCKKESYFSEEQQSALFAAPSTAEINDVYNSWQTRDLTPSAYMVVQEKQLMSGKYTFKIVSFNVEGIQEYGALLIPNTTEKMPVRMYASGFGLDITMYGMILELNPSGSDKPFILAMPTLRGQALQITINDTTYTTPLSGGNHCDAFDGGTDDVIAFLNLIEQTEPNADVNRTSVRGGSRGGTVALLAGIRDTRIKRVVCVAGPANMLTLSSAHINDDTYRCQFLSAYKNGAVSLSEARNKMIASSPAFFADRLPLVQMHMGLKDSNVPIWQAYEFQNRVDAAGKTSDFQLFTYYRTHSNIATNNPDLAQRIEDFLSQL